MCTSATFNKISFVTLLQLKYTPQVEDEYTYTKWYEWLLGMTVLLAMHMPYYSNRTLTMGILYSAIQWNKPGICLMRSFNGVRSPKSSLLARHLRALFHFDELIIHKATSLRNKSYAHTRVNDSYITICVVLGG